MILSRTPLRISFVGGGSDLRAYYSYRLGAVFSTTIDKYIYVCVNHRPDGLIRVSYSKAETVDSVDKVEHDIIREALKLTGINNGVEINYMGDFPIGNAGTGLGSSSALAVGTLNALYALQGKKISSEELAHQACEIEIEKLKRPIGKQDQYAAAIGGFNYIEFRPDESVVVMPISLDTETLATLYENLMLFNTRMATASSSVLEEQREKTKDNLEVLDALVRLTHEIQEVLLNKNFKKFGELLHENWIAKKKLASKITNETLDLYYEKARSAGAIGGKILGSGGGGFLLFYVEKENQDKVRNALKDLQLTPFQFEPNGSNIVYQD